MTAVLLLGMGPTALSALDSLVMKFDVLGVVRSKSIEPGSIDPVMDRAEKLAIPIYSDVSVAAVITLVQQLQPDCVVVSSYDRLLPPKLTTRLPFVNVHYAPLPQYRGRANVNWALINDEDFSAITIHTIASELDAGNILFQQYIPIEDFDTVADLYQKLNAIQQLHLAETVEQFLDGYEGTPQDSKNATYGCTRIPEDGEIDWTSSTRKIDRLIRALVSPFPGAYTYYQGRRLTVWKAIPVGTPLTFKGRVPGRVVGISKSEGSIDVLTGDGVLKVLEVQLQGECKAEATDVIKSVRSTLGLRTIDLLERIQALEHLVAKLITTCKGNENHAK